MFSLFYKGNLFSNKSSKNYIMPFTSNELGCNKNDLNELIGKVDVMNQTPERFDFRDWFHQFDSKFSQEAKDLYISALDIFKYYHKTYKNTNYNDSFYDIISTIMGKDPNKFKDLETDNDTRISKVKTTKGTTGFSRNALLKENNQYISNDAIPMFRNFFDARDVLAKKINKQLLDQKLILWERENIY